MVGASNGRSSLRGTLFGPRRRPTNSYRCRSSGRHTTHKQAFTATIHYRYHPRYGEQVLIIGSKRHKEEKHLLLEERDGTKAYIPAWMTHPALAGVEAVDIPRIELTALENLRRLLDNLLSSPPWCSVPTAGGDQIDTEQLRPGGSIPRSRTFTDPDSRGKTTTRQGVARRTDAISGRSRSGQDETTGDGK